MGNVFKSVLAAVSAVFQSKTVTPTTSQQTITPDSGYDGLSSVTIEPVTLQTKQANVTPTASWSSEYTAYATVTKDSNYMGMESVQVRAPMIRDNTLVTASAVSTPSNVYNGDTAQSNSQKCLRIAPTKDGMAYTGSYLYLKPNSYLGDAAASNVLSGKTFSSANGIQITGTYNLPSGNKALSYTDNGTESNIDVSGYATVSVTRDIHPDPYVESTQLWANSSPTSNYTSETVTLSQSMTNFDYLLFNFRVSTTVGTPIKFIVDVSEFKEWVKGSYPSVEFRASLKNTSSANNASRGVQYVSNTSVYITSNQYVNSSGTAPSWMIPVSIQGLKLTTTLESETGELDEDPTL